MADIHQLLKERDEELFQLQQEFKEFQEMSKILEEELESELDSQTKANLDLIRENQQLKDKVEKINVRNSAER